MPISFACACGKGLRARDELAGKKAKCPQCGAVVSIPTPEVDPDRGDGIAYGLHEPDPGPPPAPGLDDEYALRPSVYMAAPSEPRRDRDAWSGPAPGRPSSTKGMTYGPEIESSGTSIREYAYLLLGFALIPLVFSLLNESKIDIEERIKKTFENATPEQVARAMPVLNKDTVGKEELFGVLPDGKLHGAHLPHDTMLHWVYAGVATVGFLLLIMAFFSVERAEPLHLLGVGLFTGTVGILFLFLMQFCAGWSGGLPRGRYPWFILVIVIILWLIGLSYASADAPDSNFLLSALGFTFGVGLCEEFTKAIPLFFYFQRDARMGWRGACLWGLASGIGFGVSEGIMYSSRYYNGLLGADIYVVRFVSCVALHAMWSASVGIAIARKLDVYQEVSDAAGFGFFMVWIVAVPMTLHGFYDTLLKKDMNVWALLVALASFGWLTIQIELARGAHPEAGSGGRKKRLAY